MTEGEEQQHQQQNGGSAHEDHQQKQVSTDRLSPCSTFKSAPSSGRSAPEERPGESGLERPSLAESSVSAGLKTPLGRTLDPEMAKTFDNKLRGMSAKMRHLGQTLAPWTVVDNKARAKKVAEVLEQDRAQIVDIMNAMMEAYKEAAHEASEARLAMADREEKERAAKQKAEQLERVNEEVENLREFKQNHSSNTKRLLQRVDTISRGPQQQTGGEESAPDLEMLREKVEELLVEHERLTAEAEKAIKAKQDMEKKWKELQAKAADDNEVKGREIKHLQSTIKKLEEKKESEVAAAKKEVADMREQRKKDTDLTQRRLNSSKVEVDGYKAREKTSKAQLDEAVATATKAQEDVKTFKGRLADARAAKEDLQRYLDMAKYEADLVADEYRELVQSVVQSQGFNALPCSKYFVKHTAPFPRTAFTMKNGNVLYNRAIHPGIDVSKIVPRDYNSHKELQEMMVEEGLVLDRQCGPETF